MKVLDTLIKGSSTQDVTAVLGYAEICRHSAEELLRISVSNRSAAGRAHALDILSELDALERTLRWIPRSEDSDQFPLFRE